MMKTVKQISIIIMISMLLIVTTALCISVTVISQEKNAKREETAYYRALEQKYVGDMRVFLEQEGYVNSGITMTEVVEADGNRHYTVTIHHKRIQRLSEGERQELLTACKQIAFEDENCQVFHKFLEEDL